MEHVEKERERQAIEKMCVEDTINNFENLQQTVKDGVNLTNKDFDLLVVELLKVIELKKIASILAEKE